MLPSKMSWMDTSADRTPVNPLVLVWLSWTLGPVGLVYSAATNDGEPDCCLAFLLVGGHGAAVLLTIAMMGSQKRFARVPEFWFMLTYWVPLAGFVLAMATDWLDVLGRPCLLTSLAWVVLVPAAGVVRLLRMLWRAQSHG